MSLTMRRLLPVVAAATIALTGSALAASPAMAANPETPVRDLAISDLTVLGGTIRDASGTVVKTDACGKPGTVVEKSTLLDGSTAYYTHGDAIVTEDGKSLTDMTCTYSLKVTAPERQAFNLTNLWMAGQSVLEAGAKGQASISVSAPSGGTELTGTIEGPTDFGTNWNLTGLPSDKALIGNCGATEELVITQKLHLDEGTTFSYLSNVADPGWNSVRAHLSSIPCNN
ncbi:DUF4360 domain-containing protein [Actinoplanes sp. NPDC051859]|uniref:DUF4360 domain-containing protein n=1 Tax=Actinoplanes sp. NPDC051859 TaxID=3363909 RepID=UPI0037A211C1